METEEKLFMREKEIEARDRQITELETEIAHKAQTIEKIQQEKRDLAKQNVTDDTFADTYEAVMQVEFETMKNALARRAGAAEERAEAIEKEYTAKIKDLLKAQKDERLVHEIKLRRATTEIHVLQDKLKPRE